MSAVKNFYKKLCVGLLFFLCILLPAQTADAAIRQYTEKEKRALGIYFVGGKACSEAGNDDTESSATGADKVGTIYMLGDSITVGAKNALESELKPKPYVNASGNRSITGAGNTPGFTTSGLEATEGDKARIKTSASIVVALGTNQNNGFEDSIRQLVQRIKSYNKDAKVYWVNVFSKGSVDRDKINKSIKNLSSSQNYTIIETTDKKIELGPDKVHPTPSGSKTFAKVVSEGVGSENSSEPPKQAGGCKCGGGSSKLVGSKNEEKIFNFLVGKGLSKVQAAGIVGNFSVESGFDPFKQEIGKTPPNGGYGIAQWTGTGRPGDPAGARRLNLIKAVKGAGLGVELESQTVKKSAGNEPLLAAELDYLWKEANDRGNIAQIKTEKTVKGAVISWLKNFEIAGIPHLEGRVQAGKDAIAKYGSGGGAGDSGSSDGTTCSKDEGSGEVTGEYSLPVAKKWYKQHPEWFSKPHHDHVGSDIPVPRGTPVYSMTAGKIIAAPNEGGYGRGVTVDAGNGVQYVYGHGTDGGSVKGAKNGDTVKPGQLLMHVNNTGESLGDHLHLSINVKGVGKCPQKMLIAIGGGKSPPKESSLPTTGCFY